MIFIQFDTGDERQKACQDDKDTNHKQDSSIMNFCVSLALGMFILTKL